MQILYRCCLALTVVTFFPRALSKKNIDVTLVGSVKYADGLCRIPIGIVDVLKDELTINYRLPDKGVCDFTDISPEVKSVFDTRDRRPGNVALLTSPLWYIFADTYKAVPAESLIKIAYSMIEGTAIPQTWVTILNKHFDAVVVPDQYYVAVYRTSGVEIPIFVLPHGLYLDDFLEEPIKSLKSDIFTFGQTSLYYPRKNQLALLQAFYEEFKDEPNVRLKMHGRWGDPSYIKLLRDRIHHYNVPNIEFIESTFLEDQQLEFFRSIDCLVLCSKGEGFSLTPREALALGIPCIISDNTAHRTICDTGFVYGVPSAIPEKVDYRLFFGEDDCGYCFDTKIDDVRKALRKVYTECETYQKKALEGRKWVERYTWQNLKARFRNLLKPTEIRLGSSNEITDTYLMTDSKALYKKYVYIRANNNKKMSRA